MISDATLRRVLPAPAVRLCGDLVRALAWIGVFLVWAGFSQVYLRMVRLTLTDPSNSDFTIFYYTARLVGDGLPMYGQSPARYGIAWSADHLGNLNPPHFQLVTWPMRWLSYEQALAFWVLLNGIALAVAVTLVQRELRVRLGARQIAVLGAATMAAAPFTTVAVTSEMTFLLMVPFTLAWIAWRRAQWGRAGAWLGICVSLKLFLLLFVPWLLWRRRWRAIGALMLTTSLAVVAGIAVFGIEPYRLWIETLGRVGWWWLPMNASWEGLVSRVLAGSGRVAAVVSLPALVKPVALLGAATLALVTLVRVRNLDHGSGHRNLVFLTLFVGALLASPLGWVYYFPLAYGPILAWLGVGEADVPAERTPRHWGLLAAGLACLYVPQEVASAGQPSALATLTIASAYFWGTGTLWGLLMREAGR